jgi:hypothetical protein
MVLSTLLVIGLCCVSISASPLLLFNHTPIIAWFITNFPHVLASIIHNGLLVPKSLPPYTYNFQNAGSVMWVALSHVGVQLKARASSRQQLVG